MQSYNRGLDAAANHEVSIRILPHGEPCQALVQGQDELTLNLIPEPPGMLPLRHGNLVEIHTSDSIYLGEVLHAGDPLVEIRIEHSLNLRELDAIQAHWNRPAGFF